MIIKVNKMCFINNQNIAKSIDNREVAINVITADNSEDNGFINYCLAMDGDSQCCEVFGTWLLTSFNLDKSIFVTKIEHGINYETIPKNMFPEEFEQLGNECGFFATNVYGIIDGVEKIVATGVCYNEHNGYYSHYVYSDINNRKNIEVCCI